MAEGKQNGAGLPDFMRQYWGPLTGVASIISMLAVGNTTLHLLITEQEKMNTILQSLSQKLEEHQRSGGHSLSDQRQHAAERRLDEITTQQRENEKEIRVRLEAIDRNMTALCVASRGAGCVLR